jgi:hypothetical protein
MSTYNVSNYAEPGGASQVFGGTVDFTGTIKKSGTALTASASELNTLTGVTATASEINLNDTSVQTETILVAGAISPTTKITKLSAASGAYAVTLAAPGAGMLGQTKTIEMTVAGAAITLALTNVQGGTASTSASFDAVNETLTLVAGTSKWTVTGQAGVTLS